MNTVESIFTAETSISGLVELFKLIIGDAADILNPPSCEFCSLANTE